MAALTLDVWSDIACPWCWVGKRHLELALQQWEGAVTVRWRAFELDRSAPKRHDATIDYVDRLARKYGASRGHAQRMIDQMVARGAERGLDFRFDRVQPVSTFDAHRLLHWASTLGRGDATKEQLFRAYMTEGRCIADADVLVDVAAEVGLDADAAVSVVATDRFAAEVRADEALAGRLGIEGVPFFVVAERYAVSGAQPPEVLLEVLGRAAAEAPQRDGEPEGPACGPDGCPIP